MALKTLEMLKRFSLILIIILGFSLRLYGLNWDEGHHLHPDERAIVMVSEKIRWPKEGEWSKLLTPESPLNPKFFAYGSFPIYLLKFTGFIGSFFDKTLVQYDKINLLGRVLSALFDTATIFFIFPLTKNLFPNRPKIPIFAAFFYALSVLPIQLSHFFAVDTILNFFIWLTILWLTAYFEKPSIPKIAAAGTVAGLAIATKFTGALLLAPSIIATILAAWCHHQKNGLQRGFRKFTTHLVLFAVNCSLFIFLAMPYAFIDFPTFVVNISEQLRMAKDPYVFPFTLQYVNSTPYLYPLQQIFLWGLGPVISLLALLGLLLLVSRTSITVYTMILRQKFRGEIAIPSLIVGTFCLLYFLILGQSAVKFMRYYLPLYPLLTILAAYFIDTFLVRTKHVLGQYFALITTILLISISLLWPLSFVNIYNKPNTRVTASDWIKKNIAEGSVLAVEHWDDRLPLSGGEKFSFVEMPMYDRDSSDTKWEKINGNLKKADYIVLASNRLYTPLSKLTDCPKIKYEWRCYPKTDKYYRELFSGNLGFTKIVQFTNYPKFSILNYLPIESAGWLEKLGQFSINDDSADENFTVFDHPKIIIFKKQ